VAFPARGAIVIDDRDGLAGEALGVLLRIGQRRGGEHELWRGPVQGTDATQPAQETSDM